MLHSLFIPNCSTATCSERWATSFLSIRRKRCSCIRSRAVAQYAPGSFMPATTSSITACMRGSIFWARFRACGGLRGGCVARSFLRDFARTADLQESCNRSEGSCKLTNRMMKRKNLTNQLRSRETGRRVGDVMRCVKRRRLETIDLATNKEVVTKNTTPVTCLVSFACRPLLFVIFRTRALSRDVSLHRKVTCAFWGQCSVLYLFTNLPEAESAGSSSIPVGCMTTRGSVGSTSVMFSCETYEQ